MQYETTYLSQSNKRAIYMSLTGFAILFAIALYVVNSRDGGIAGLFNRGEQMEGNMGEGLGEIAPRDNPKQVGCYSDYDCPDETRCDERGLCVPIIHNLPVSKHMLETGRGRSNEKPI